MRAFGRVLAFVALLASPFACGGEGGVGDGDADGDVDSDADRDADTDVDTAGDADTDLDGDGEHVEWWRATLGTTWHIQFTGTLDTSLDVDMYDIDLFDTPQDVIDELHAASRIVVCYFSAGSREDWRPDADEFPPATIGAPLEGWEGEHWIDITSPAVRDIMLDRLDLAVSRDCDAVDPDNVNAFENASGLGITAEEQLDFNRFLAREAHARGLAVGLKNDGTQAAELEPEFDFEINEECLTFDECGQLSPFVAAGKAVFHIEYVDDPDDGPARAAEVCADPAVDGFSTVIKTWELDAWMIACD